ncbi:MAG: hypothetical protein AAFQ41_16315 [Cyanobacteria bacterium J06623_7]
MSAEFWYVIKQPDGACTIEQFASKQAKTPEREQWGAYDRQVEAIAKRVGLIRAKKCRPK